jgi:hypothetical protein
MILTPDFPVLAAFVPQASDSSRCRDAGFQPDLRKFMRATGARKHHRCLLRLIQRTLMLTRRSMMQSNHLQTLSQIGPELLSVRFMFCIVYDYCDVMSWLHKQTRLGAHSFSHFFSMLGLLDLKLRRRATRQLLGFY